MHHSIEYPCCNSRNMLLQCTSEPAVVQWYSGTVVPSQSLSAEAQNPFCPAAAKPVARIYFLTFSTRSLCNKTKTMHFCAKQISPFFRHGSVSSTYPGRMFLNSSLAHVKTHVLARVQYTRASMCSIYTC